MYAHLVLVCLFPLDILTLYVCVCVVQAQRQPDALTLAPERSVFLLGKTVTLVPTLYMVVNVCRSLALVCLCVSYCSYGTYLLCVSVCLCVCVYQVAIGQQADHPVRVPGREPSTRSDAG